MKHILSLHKHNLFLFHSSSYRNDFKILLANQSSPYLYTKLSTLVAFKHPLNYEVGWTDLTNKLPPTSQHASTHLTVSGNALLECIYMLVLTFLFLFTDNVYMDCFPFFSEHLTLVNILKVVYNYIET